LAEDYGAFQLTCAHRSISRIVRIEEMILWSIDVHANRSDVTEIDSGRPSVFNDGAATCLEHSSTRCLFRDVSSLLGFRRKPETRLLCSSFDL